MPYVAPSRCSRAASYDPAISLASPESEEDRKVQRRVITTAYVSTTTIARNKDSTANDVLLFCKSPGK